MVIPLAAAGNHSGQPASRPRRIEGISDIRNESGRAGMRIVDRVSRSDANATGRAQSACTNTPSFRTPAPINMLALVERRAEGAAISRRSCSDYIQSIRRTSSRRRTQFELATALEHEAHIYEGLQDRHRPHRRGHPRSSARPPNVAATRAKSCRRASDSARRSRRPSSI